MKCSCRTIWIWFLAALFAGCSESPSGQQSGEFSAIRLVSNEVVQDTLPEPRLAGLISTAELGGNQSSSTPVFEKPPVEARSALELAWAFPSDNTEGVLLKLPAVDGSPNDEAPNGETPLSNPATTEGDLKLGQPIASLLPPQSLEVTALEVKSEEVLSENTNEVATKEEVATTKAELSPVTPEIVDAAALEKELVAAAILDSTASTTGVLTDNRVNELAKTKIRSAYAMANRGGYYAARQELIEVLRMISHAKDAQQAVRQRTEALAEGLRALEEAEDFSPRGIQLEADLAIEVLCASHRTPISKQIEFKEVLPYQMMNGYFRYAQLKLAAAVDGAPAGSMALHALGKLATQLGQVEPEKHRLAQRHAIAFQQAALLSHNENHLAAHELATLLADAGHFVEAEKLLRRVAARDPNAVVLRNLALMQQKLGLPQQAIANRALAIQQAQNGASGTNNVQWVSPQEFSRSGGFAPSVPSAPVATVATSNPVVASPVQPAIRIPGKPFQQNPFASPVRR